MECRIHEATCRNRHRRWKTTKGLQSVKCRFCIALIYVQKVRFLSSCSLSHCLSSTMGWLSSSQEKSCNFVISSTNISPSNNNNLKPRSFMKNLIIFIYGQTKKWCFFAHCMFLIILSFRTWIYINTDTVPMIFFFYQMGRTTGSLIVVIQGLFSCC